jgi:chromosome segregation ATPase
VFSRLEREELQERIRLLNEENQLYITKVKEYEGAIFGLRGRNEIYGKHEQSYVNEIHELQEQVKKLEIDGDDLRVRREVLENKLRNQVELNAMQEEERNEVLQKLSRAENEVKVLRH